MNTEDRETYARMAFEGELNEVAIVEFVSEADLDENDPHRPYGLMAPIEMEANEEKWRIKVAIPLLLRHVVDRDDEVLNQWISYWCNHFYFHIIVFDWVESRGFDLTKEEIESRVEEEFEGRNPILYAFGASLKG